MKNDRKDVKSMSVQYLFNYQFSSSNNCFDEPFLSRRPMRVEFRGIVLEK